MNLLLMNDKEKGFVSLFKKTKTRILVLRASLSFYIVNEDASKLKLKKIRKKSLQRNLSKATRK